VIGGSHSGVHNLFVLRLTIWNTKTLFQNLVSITSDHISTGRLRSIWRPAPPVWWSKSSSLGYSLIAGISDYERHFHLILIGEMAWPTKAVSRFMRKSSVLGWIMLAQPGGLLPAPTSGAWKWHRPMNCNWLTLSVSYKQIYGGFGGSVFRWPHQSANREFRKLASAENLLARQLTVDCLCRPRADQNHLKP